MKILICGSEGRIMSRTIPRLLEGGHEVIGVDHCGKWGSGPARRDYRFVEGDCSDPDLMRPLMREADGVIQAAATLFGVIGFHRRAADILTGDLAVHQTALRLAHEEEVERVVYTSSSMVYECCTSEPHREEDADTAPLPRTDYGLSKIVGERLSRAYEGQYRLPFTIWRPFNALDPEEEGGTQQGVSHVFADMCRRIILERQDPLEILGDGHQVRSFVHIDEVAEVIARFSFDERTLNQAYNVGRDEPVTMRELAGLLHRKSRERGLVSADSRLRFRCLPVPESDVRRRVGCFEKVRRELGWTSRIPLDRSLDDCLDSFAARRAEAPSSRMTAS
jgi:nucleoside-diphosphate-sugar epimerase